MTDEKKFTDRDMFTFITSAYKQGMNAATADFFTVLQMKDAGVADDTVVEKFKGNKPSIQILDEQVRAGTITYEQAVKEAMLTLMMGALGMDAVGQTIKEARNKFGV